MSDDNHNQFNEKPSANELLDELGSLKELLDEEIEQTAHYSSVEEINSVEAYLRLKQAAEQAGLSLEEYLAQQTQSLTDSAQGPDDDQIPLLDEVVVVEDDAPLLPEVTVSEEEAEAAANPTTATTVEEYFAAVAAAKQTQRGATAVPPVLDEIVPPSVEEEDVPVLDEIVDADSTIPVVDEVVVAGEGIPLLDEVAEIDASSTGEGMSLEEMQSLVDLIVNRKLERLKPELEKEVMGELQKLLPLSSFENS